jgi:hypothetical protein
VEELGKLMGVVVVRVLGIIDAKKWRWNSKLGSSVKGAISMTLVCSEWENRSTRKNHPGTNDGFAFENIENAIEMWKQKSKHSSTFFKAPRHQKSKRKLR